MKHLKRKMLSRLLCCAICLMIPVSFLIEPCGTWADDYPKEKVVIRVCSWEEYIDEGRWDEDEVIDLESGDIFGENNMVDDFEEWYEDTYGIEVKVEYSTFGTNEDLYNMLTIGDVYDLVCP